MKYIAPKILVICVLACSTFAQENDLQLIDEFGRANDEERLARTDNLANALRNNPDKLALINISGGRDRSPSFNYLYGALIKAQLINHSKIDPARIEIQNCSVHDPEIINRFYIASKNAARPACDSSFPAFQDTAYFGTANEGSFEMGCCEVMGGAEAVLETFERVIIDLLKKHPGAKVTMIGYSGTNMWRSENSPVKTRIVTRKWRKWDSPLIVANMIRKVTSRFTKNGISPNRINIIAGGYKYYGGHVEFWIIPEGGGKTPKAKPDFVIKTTSKKRLK